MLYAFNSIVLDQGLPWGPLQRHYSTRTVNATREYALVASTRVIGKCDSVRCFVNICHAEKEPGTGTPNAAIEGDTHAV
jgi:chloramphenicol O-acetyltransferase